MPDADSPPKREARNFCKYGTTKPTATASSTLLELAEHKEGDNGAAAANAGLKVNDVITQADGRPIASIADFEDAWHSSGDRVATSPFVCAATTAGDGIGADVDRACQRAGAPTTIPAMDHLRASC